MISIQREYPLPSILISNQSSESIGLEICRHLYYAIMIPLVITKRILYKIKIVTAHNGYKFF
jgi:hypothetical protein